MFDAGHVFTWAEFRTAFHAAYIPKPIIDLKRREFLDLTQGRMDIQAYGREFNHLSRYAPRDVTNDEDKQYLFRKGLVPRLRYELLPFPWDQRRSSSSPSASSSHSIGSRTDALCFAGSHKSISSRDAIHRMSGCAVWTS